MVSWGDEFITSRDPNLLEPELRKRYFMAWDDYVQKYPDEPTPFIVCTYRSLEEQAELYEVGRSKPGNILTWIKEGMHNQQPALAVDIAFNIPKAEGGPYARVDLFEKFAELIKVYGVKWGGDWTGGKIDRPHFEAPIALKDFKSGKKIKWPELPNKLPFNRVFLVTSDNTSIEVTSIDKVSLVGDKLYVKVGWLR